MTLLGLLGALVACVLAIFAFALLEPAIAVGLVAAMALVGLGAAARRVPLALWWTAGALIGGALGLWS